MGYEFEFPSGMFVLHITDTENPFQAEPYTETWQIAEIYINKKTWNKQDRKEIAECLFEVGHLKSHTPHIPLQKR